MWDEILSQINHKTTPQKAISCWGGDIKTLELINVGINVVYRFICARQVCYLKMTHSQLRSRVELEAALTFQQYLQKSDVPVCPLIASTHSRIIEPVKQGVQTFLAHVCRSVPGKSVHFDYGQTFYRHWGQALGRLHLASTSYKCKQHNYGQWEDDSMELEHYAEKEDPIIQKELATVLDFFEGHKRTPENYGLIHGDHRKGNVLTDGKRVYFIDFDLPRFYWFMDDISRPFFSSIMQTHQNWQDKLLPYIKGYRSVFNLKDIDLKTFSWFMRYKALNMYLWTKNNWKNDKAPGGANAQEWLRLMQRMIKIQDWVPQTDRLIKQLLEKL